MQTIELEKSVSFKNILVATDFSEVSRKAMPYAAAFAGRYGSKLYLVHVIPPEPRPQIPIEPLAPELDRDRSHAELAMKTFVSGEMLRNVAHEILLERGPIWDVLSGIDAAE